MVVTPQRPLGSVRLNATSSLLQEAPLGPQALRLDACVRLAHSNDVTCCYSLLSL